MFTDFNILQKALNDKKCVWLLAPDNPDADGWPVATTTKYPGVRVEVVLDNRQKMSDIVGYFKRRDLIVTSVLRGVVVDEHGVCTISVGGGAVLVFMVRIKVPLRYRVMNYIGWLKYKYHRAIEGFYQTKF